MSSNQTAEIMPIPLFGTIEAFTKNSEKEYAADRPAIISFIDQFDPAIMAMDDYKYVRAFLKAYTTSKATFNSYRIQVERFVLWSWIKAEKSITNLRRSDIESFLEFSASPDRNWVGNEVAARFLESGGLWVPNERWRPFSKRVSKTDRKSAEDNNRKPSKAIFTMSPASLRQVVAACSSFYDFMVQDEIMAGNPFLAIKRRVKIKDQTKRSSSGKALTPLQWEYIIDLLEARAESKTAAAERDLFIVTTLMAMYLRISDLVGLGKWKPTMGSFIKDNNGWWYEVEGKGGVKAQIAVKPDYMQYLKRYRLSRGLSELPYTGEQTPLLTSLSGRAGLTDRQVRNLIQKIFDEACARMKVDGHAEDEIANLRTATLHWFRHTAATFDAPLRDAKHLQADMRHKELSTTQNIYYSTFDNERAAGIEKLKMRR